MQSLLSPGRVRAAAGALASIATLTDPAAATASEAGFSATMRVPTHAPTLGQTWTLSTTIVEQK